jgi:shikimate kinase
VLLPENRERLAGRGTVVFLDTTVEQQLERTRRSRHRPLLAAGDRRAKLEELALARGPLYRSIAAITIRTDGRAPTAVAADIARALDKA